MTSRKSLIFFALCIVLYACKPGTSIDNLIDNLAYLEAYKDTVIIGTGHGGYPDMMASIMVVKFYNSDLKNKVIVEHPIKAYNGTIGAFEYAENKGLCLNCLLKPYEHICSLHPDVVTWMDEEMHLSGTSPYIPLTNGYYMIDWKWQQLFPLSALTNYAFKNSIYDQMYDHITKHLFVTDIDWENLHNLNAIYDNSLYTQHIAGLEVVRVQFIEIDDYFSQIKQSDQYVCWNISLYHDGLSIKNAYLYYTLGDCSSKNRTHQDYIRYCDSLQNVYQNHLLEIIKEDKLKELGF